MAFDINDVTKLERAIASGVLTVRFGDRQTTYQSLGDMRAALRDIRAEVAAASGQKPRRRTMNLYQRGNGLG